MTPRAGAPLRFRLPRLYWPYQLAFAAAQILSALVVTALLLSAPSPARGLLIELPPLLALASLGVRGPVEKVGLIIESGRVVVAGRSIPFTEIVRVVHRRAWQRFDDGEGPPTIVHVWKLRLQLLTGDDVLIFEDWRSRLASDRRPPPADAYGAHMAREIRAARARWSWSLRPSMLRDLREDLLEFRRYRPAPSRWQAAVASQGFSLTALGLAAWASVFFAACAGATRP